LRGLKKKGDGFMVKAFSKANGLLVRIKNVLGGLGFLLNARRLAQVEKEMARELAQAPCIVLLGETGVGKSSTLNALFNAGADIDHIRPCTIEPAEYAVVTEMSGSHGVFRVFDMPGLGQDLEADHAFLKEYARILPQCDVALWVLDGSTRTLSQAQAALRGVVTAAMSGLDRLVIGINKIDRLEPGDWNFRSNTPSREQKQNIAARVEDVCTRLAGPVGLQQSRIVPYSAKQHFHLGNLLLALLDACPKDRRWVVHDRVNLASYEELVDPVILKQLKEKHRLGAIPKKEKRGYGRVS
jgi:uncharacterized protein